MTHPRQFLYLLGFIFTIGGAVMLFFPLYEIYMIFENTEESFVVKKIVQAVVNEEKVFFGLWAGESFELTLSPAAQKTTFSILGVIALSLVSGILLGVVNVGVQMIRVAFLSETELKKFEEAQKNKASSSG